MAQSRPAPRRRALTSGPWRRLGNRALQALAIAYLLLLIAVVISYKGAHIELLLRDPFFGIYSLVVCTYILSRFLLSLAYRPVPDRGHLPSVAIVVPALNEQEAIGASLRSLLELEYPRDRLEVIAVNDGSTDDTLAVMHEVAAASDGRVTVVDFGVNQGKRAAMATGIKASQAEIVCFVDSDSMVSPDGLRQLVQPFADDRVGAVCGHADVLNVRKSWMTKMQAVRYFVAFRVIKGSESLYRAVTCCSGCFSAYRRSAMDPRLEWWESQSFLGRPSTFGDDRSLTNCILRDWQVVYQSTAVCETIVPETLRVFLTQQVRWKRSWTRESTILAGFAWRINPLAAAFAYTGIALPLLAPIVAVRTCVVLPLAYGLTPLVYLMGIYAIALVYALYYAAHRSRYDTLWFYGVMFVFFYLAFLIWQTYYAILTCRTTGWGTRSAEPEPAGAPA